MAYRSYDYFTRKQCNLLYKTFMRGQLVPPKDCRGKVKRPGFVYRYENCSRYLGMYISPEQELFNCQMGVLREVISCICKGDLERAQALLNCEDEWMLFNYLPEGVEPKKFWKSV